MNQIRLRPLCLRRCRIPLSPRLRSDAAFPPTDVPEGSLGIHADLTLARLAQAAAPLDLRDASSASPKQVLLSRSCG